ncbi:MAG: 2-hydroxyacyl-CoA dehydratase [Bacilli bacterium]|jgi:predicted nucleotide-binding protein (sugar kinase/HSP70/actin superfamily)
MNKKIIAFPHLANYYVPITFLFTHLTSCEVLKVPAITKKTIDLGIKYSPEFVCMPFKYNLGNFIEALDLGANIIIQAGGGCRYGYYAEVQKQILQDLNYKFTFYSLTESDKVAILSIYKIIKQLNPKLSFFKYFYYLIITMKMVHYMDKIDAYIRKNIGFEVVSNSFDDLLSNMLDSFGETKSLFHLNKLYHQYLRMFKKLEISKPKKTFKVGIIGELYNSMEPFANYDLEKMLAKMQIEVSRYTNLTYLIITKRFNNKKLLKICNKYCRYPIGADGTDNIARTISLALEGYDGIIHVKPFGCTPEIGAMHILNKVSEDYQIPIIYFTFDNQTSIEGIKTRLEAFHDMIKMRRSK